MSQEDSTPTFNICAGKAKIKACTFDYAGKRAEINAVWETFKDRYPDEEGSVEILIGMSNVEDTCCRRLPNTTGLRGSRTKGLNRLVTNLLQIVYNVVAHPDDVAKLMKMIEDVIKDLNNISE
ncbi:Protein of unknown function [Pyronema omphalodes CBS 100304]|uniref:Uncharacterized protein n=1 Tax=Pyronema omphalodes (strain CBS 100304) TaxID=1076935 RepID=U4LP28_PYROM|nr:Protein of unknown function [Pyronema omphalodes CBS 100304]